MENLYDLIIVGGGSAATAAGIYARRQNLKTLLIAKTLGGQMAQKAVEIENYPGFNSISGLDLITKFSDQLKKFKTEILFDAVVKIEKEKSEFSVFTETNDIFKAKAVIVASGSEKRFLNVPREKEFVGKGVSYCSICDGAMFQGKTVAVIGGGNAGFEAAFNLSKIAKKVYIIEFNQEVLADEENKKILDGNSKIEIITGARVSEILGDKFVEGLKYEDLINKEIKELKLEGIFIEIGWKPATGFLNENLCDFNERGELVIDFKANITKTPGLFAAGDVTNTPYKQILVSAGEGAKAALSAIRYLKDL